MRRGNARRQMTGWQAERTKAEWAERAAELESIIEAALRHAEKNGMADWPAFKALRQAISE